MMNSKSVVMTQKEQKEIMLNILDVFSMYCEKYNLQYFLDAGTLIGAVRHKGYIPWDDDIDVNMPRIDYDQFCAIVKKNNSYIAPHIHVEFPEDTIYPFLKLSDDRTVLVEFPERNPMKVEVYIDIFAKDGIKDGSLYSKTVCKISELLGLGNWFYKFSVDAWEKDNSVIKKIIVCGAELLTTDKNWPVKLQDRFIHWNQKLNPLENCKYVTTLTNGEFHKIAPKECFDDYTMMDFEGKKFRCPIGYDTYLRCLYPGDYMQLPPEDKRVHHDTIIYWKSEADKEDFYRSCQ